MRWLLVLALRRAAFEQALVVLAVVGAPLTTRPPSPFTLGAYAPGDAGFVLGVVGTPVRERSRRERERHCAKHQRHEQGATGLRVHHDSCSAAIAIEPVTRPDTTAYEVAIGLLPALPLEASGRGRSRRDASLESERNTGNQRAYPPRNDRSTTMHLLSEGIVGAANRTPPDDGGVRVSGPGPGRRGAP